VKTNGSKGVEIGMKMKGLAHYYSPKSQTVVLCFARLFEKCFKTTLFKYKINNNKSEKSNNRYGILFI